MTIPEDYLGRCFTFHQLSPQERELATYLPSTQEHKKQLSCARCLGSMAYQLPSGARYCRDCITMGRVTSVQPLYTFKQQDFSTGSVLNWTGTLTPYQEEVSNQLIKAQAAKENILVHAVTGAGKTEMIYPVLEQVLSQGQAVAVVSPRIDVCKELYSRLKRDVTCSTVLLHGDSDPYTRAPLVIATVHQLYKFYQAFELVIIDEVDAFPFVDNASLYHAVERALKPSGSKIYLTATSTEQLDRQVRAKQLKKVHLARRFHGNPLVIPTPVWLAGLLDSMTKGRLPKKLLNYLTRQAKIGYPLLIFFPHIALGQEFHRLLSLYFPEETIGFVSSQTQERADQVEDFRQGRLRILVTTTILERGVTFPCVDVFVLWSNHKLYTASSLIQISGRVGRSKERPTGELIFFHDGVTVHINRVITEIKEMNKKGGLA
ncbi:MULTISPECIES: DEAD/DEAH box helicase [unclassified Streptococcus]|uniref:DEAD/DEAH box helicase n=1 Tax=unclassified Streptococcus TaxID=2608887 RepID=UPI00359E0FF0